MLNTQDFLFKGRDVQPVFHPEGWEQVANSPVHQLAQTFILSLFISVNL